MSGQRLEYHYHRLLAQFPSGEATITLQALADGLCCSKRHMRTLLSNMQQRGWLYWQATAGRGHQARLSLLRDKQQLKVEKADQLLKKGDIAAAVELLDDEKNQLASLLRSRLGYRVNDDYQSLHVPYYRAMPNLYPGTPLRRSEIHLVRQIFNGLTRINTQTGEVESDLAHRWRQQDTLHWRFFLRPGVRFHDGHLLNSEDVVVSLNRCARLPLFSHIDQVTSSGSLVVDVALTQEDPQLPLLFTDPAALILPGDHDQRENFAAYPIGTGPWRVSENNQWHLLLQVFEQYFALRGLLDEIEVIVWPEMTHETDQEPSLPTNQSAAWLSSSINDAAWASRVTAPFTTTSSEPHTEMFLEQGGYFLLCDSRSVHWHTVQQRRWLREKLSPWRLAQYLQDAVRPLWVPTGSLLPAWFHSIETGESRSPFVGGQNHAVLRLAYPHQHPEYARLAAIMRQLLATEDVMLEVLELDYEQWAMGDADVDLWLGTVNFPVPETWSVGTWLLGMPLLQYGLFGGDRQQYQYCQQKWRQGKLSSWQLTQKIIASGWLQPLFHHWMRLKAPENSQGIHLNNLGWFDFSTTWMEPGA